MCFVDSAPAIAASEDKMKAVEGSIPALNLCLQQKISTPKMIAWQIQHRIIIIIFITATDLLKNCSCWNQGV